MIEQEDRDFQDYLDSQSGSALRRMESDFVCEFDGEAYDEMVRDDMAGRS